MARAGQKQPEKIRPSAWKLNEISSSGGITADILIAGGGLAGGTLACGLGHRI